MPEQSLWVCPFSSCKYYSQLIDFQFPQKKMADSCQKVIRLKMRSIPPHLWVVNSEQRSVCSLPHVIQRNSTSKQSLCEWLFLFQAMFSSACPSNLIRLHFVPNFETCHSDENFNPEVLSTTWVPQLFIPTHLYPHTQNVSAFANWNTRHFIFGTYRVEGENLGLHVEDLRSPEPHASGPQVCATFHLLGDPLWPSISSQLTFRWRPGDVRHLISLQHTSESTCHQLGEQIFILSEIHSSCVPIIRIPDPGPLNWLLPLGRTSWDPGNGPSYHWPEALSLKV